MHAWDILTHLIYTFFFFHECTKLLNPLLFTELTLNIINIIVK